MLRRRLQDFEAAANNRVEDAKREKEMEFSARVDVYVAEIKKERGKCESIRREMASLKEELATAKAENDQQRRQPRQQATKKLDKNEKAKTHDATASRKKEKKQCGNNSFCAIKANKGFRATTRQLFQSRLVHVSDRFLRADSKEGRCFDFDDFLAELQGWLSILRAKNVEDDDAHEKANISRSPSLQEGISYVLTPAATSANDSVEIVAPSPVVGEGGSSI